MRGIFGSSSLSLARNHRDDSLRWSILFALAAAAMPTPARAVAMIIVTDPGAPTSSTCTLAQAIGLANYGNGVLASSIGSATTDAGSCPAHMA